MHSPKVHIKSGEAAVTFYFIAASIPPEISLEASITSSFRRIELSGSFKPSNQASIDLGQSLNKQIDVRLSGKFDECRGAGVVDAVYKL